MAVLDVTEKRNIKNKNSRSFKERKAELQAIEEHEKNLRDREPKSHFKKWVQVNLEHSVLINQLIKESPTAVLVLNFLIEHMDNTNAVMASMKVLEEAVGFKRNAISKAISLLKEKKLIYVYKSGTSNVYTINDDVYWKAKKENLVHSQFPANIIISLSEQEESVQTEFKRLKEVNIKE